MFRRASPPAAPPPAAPPAAPEQAEAAKPRRPRPAVKAKAKEEDVALLAELGVTQAGADEEDEVAALLKALSAADGGDAEATALMASLESAKEDEEVDAVLQQLGVRDGVLPPEVMSRRLDPAASMIEVERLEAAVQATKRQAVECKVAGDMDAARAKLRESKALQAALDELMAALNTDAQTEPDLLQELETSISVPAGGGTQPLAGRRAPPTAAVPQAPPSADAAAPPPDVAALREELRALKRQLVSLRDGGQTADAKAGLPRLRELERRIAEAQG
jgi:hypothetical protein